MVHGRRSGSVDQALVLDLAQLGTQLLPMVGGKAANLGELIRAGYPVPPGFCVTTQAYQQVAGVAELSGVLAASGPAAHDPGKLADRARAAILGSPVPALVADAIVRAYRALGDDVSVAVRSSATAEDLPWASFAGQQDTYLALVGAEAVLDAVRRCWASLWTNRAVSYRTSNGIDHRTVRLAVVVQRMVDAKVAGVLFTANPVTGRRGDTVIDASPGLGEAVVSGAVNPDHFVVDHRGAIVERRQGDKGVVISSRSGGGTEPVARPSDAGQPCLSDSQIRDLTTLGQGVQAHFGAPQDIEWALDGSGACWLTQARPITTLYPLPTGPDGELRVFYCIGLSQGLIRPLTPMGIASFRLIGSCLSELAFGSVVSDPLVGPPALAEAGQRLFIDVTPALRSRAGRALLPRYLDRMEARSAAVLRRLFEDPRLAVRTTSWRPSARRLLVVAVRFRIPLQVGLALVRPAAARRRVDRFGRRLRARLTVPAGVTGAQRLDHVQRLLGGAVIPIIPALMPVSGAGFLAHAVAGRLARDDLESGDLDELMRGLPHNVTTEMDLELWALATRVRADGAAVAALRDGVPAELAHRFASRQLPSRLQQGLEGFLGRYGHRAVAEVDVGMPRWSDDPTYVLGVLANYLRLEDPDLVPDAQFARGARAAEAAVAAVVEKVRRRSRLRAVAVRFALGRVRELVGMRETHKDYVVRVLAHVREQLAAIGAELAAAGLLAEPKDVFFLDLVQARAALAGEDCRAVVAQRREEYERELRRRQVPRVMLSDGTQPEALPIPGRQPIEGRLAGTPASPGTVTAVARVVLDPLGARLEPGEILVTPSTDPGWTPLFLTAGGLVTETGGGNSHGAVVAREYGIPAVVGAANATVRITTGQRITVQGATGIVELNVGATRVSPS